jgi:hypothetical protein
MRRVRPADVGTGAAFRRPLDREIFVVLNGKLVAERILAAKMPKRG